MGPPALLARLPEGCPQEDTLVDMLEGADDTAPARERRAQIEAHIDVCAACRRLLAHLAKADRAIVRKSAQGAEATLEEGLSLPAGACVGRYRIVEPIGSGGMGVVYAAYDPELDRKIALKLVRMDAIRPALASALRPRLLREAQAMARVSHPNVLAVYDAGTFDGQVFIAMELVQGRTLRAWLRAQPRSWSEILQMFLFAGRGLAAAHGAGIVHRDFKPANVLVDAVGRIRVTDFGLARSACSAQGQESAEPRPNATDASKPGFPAFLISDSSEPSGPSEPSSDLRAAALTQKGARLGTPAYMAPEQLRGQPADARSDQFSFCVALYEGLYGKRPYAQAQLIEGDGAKVGPIRPPPKGKSVPRWLRTILARGLEGAPEARYASMQALLDALREGLRRRRWRRTAWIGSAAALGATLAAIGLVGQTGRGLPSCASAPGRKLAGLWDAPRKQVLERAFLATGRAQAQQAWSRIERGVDAYASRWTELESQVCAAAASSKEASALQPRLDCLDRRLKEVRALANLFSHADGKIVETGVQAVGALPSLEACTHVSSAQASLPTDPVLRGRIDPLESRLAEVRALERAGKYAEGLEAVRGVTTEARTIGHRPLLADVLAFQGALELEVGDAQAAEHELQEAAALAEAVRQDETAANAWVYLVFVGASLDRGEQVETWARHASAAIERIGGDARFESKLDNGLGLYALKRAHYAEAERYYGNVLRRSVSKEYLAAAHLNRGIAIYRQGRLTAARADYDEALRLCEQSYGPSHPIAAAILDSLAEVSIAQGRYDEALAFAGRGLALREKTLGPEAHRTGMSHQTLGEALKGQGALEAALSHHLKALTIFEHALGPKHSETATELTALGALYREMGRHADAAAALSRSLAIWQETQPENPKRGATLAGLGDLMLAQHRLERAVGYHQRALALEEKVAGVEQELLAQPLLGLGRAYLASGLARRAKAPLERALALREAKKGDPIDLAQVQFALARALWANGERQRATDLARQARWAYQAAGTRGERPLASVEAWIAQHGLTIAGNQVQIP